jgi:hypothetical protein
MRKSNQRGLNRGGGPHRGRGRVQKAARREFYLTDVVDTAAVVRRAYCRKYLIDGRRPDPQDYRIARKALELIADPIGRAGGRGRPLLWRLRASG